MRLCGSKACKTWGVCALGSLSKRELEGFCDCELGGFLVDEFKRLSNC